MLVSCPSYRATCKTSRCPRSAPPKYASGCLLIAIVRSGAPLRDNCIIPTAIPWTFLSPGHSRPRPPTHTHAAKKIQRRLAPAGIIDALPALRRLSSRQKAWHLTQPFGSESDSDSIFRLSLDSRLHLPSDPDHRPVPLPPSPVPVGDSAGSCAGQFSTPFCQTVRLGRLPWTRLEAGSAESR